MSVDDAASSRRERAGDAFGRSTNAFTLARRLFRSRPRLLVPFFVVGVAARIVEAVRIRDPVPVVTRTFPEFGYRLPPLLFPMGYTAYGIPMGALVGLQERFLVAIAAGNAAIVALAAVATAVLVSRLLATDAFEPTIHTHPDGASDSSGPFRRSLVGVPLSRVGRLIAYALVVSLLGATVSVANTVGYLYGLVWTTAMLAVAAHLLIVPPLLVARPIGIVDAVRTSVSFCRGRGLGYAFFLALLGVGSYFAAAILPIGTVLSVTLAGSTYAVGVTSAYSEWVDSGSSPAGRED